MRYESLRAEFDRLAHEVVVFGFALCPTERSANMQELCMLAGKIALEVEGHEEEMRILCSIDSLLHRAHSAVSALEQCESLREKTARNYIGSLHAVRP